VVSKYLIIWNSLTSFSLLIISGLKILTATSCPRYSPWYTVAVALSLTLSSCSPKVGVPRVSHLEMIRNHNRSKSVHSWHNWRCPRPPRTKRRRCGLAGGGGGGAPARAHHNRSTRSRRGRTRSWKRPNLSERQRPICRAESKTRRNWFEA
jgi:hypothetical protein